MTGPQPEWANPDSYQHLRFRVDAIDCPRCQAATGMTCNTTGGYSTIHKARMNAAAKLTVEEANERIGTMLANRAAARAATVAFFAAQPPVTPERRAELDEAHRKWMAAGRTSTPTE